MQNIATLPHYGNGIRKQQGQSEKFLSAESRITGTMHLEIYTNDGENYISINLSREDAKILRDVLTLHLKQTKKVE